VINRQTEQHLMANAGDDDELAETYNTALALEKAGDHEAAARAYARVLELDPEDHGGAAVRLASMGKGAVPDRASEAYVETLFDQHADAFEDILVDQLGYHVPLTLRAALGEHAPGPYVRLLDLGCGTGLAGVALSDITHHRTGIDLSSRMVDIAGESDLYDELYVGDVVAFVQEIEDEAPWDLIVATDVLPYLGGVEELFAGVRRVSAPGAVFAFSTELLEGDGQTFTVGPHQRFHHAIAYLTRELDAAGFALIHVQDITVRHEEGEPQPGHLVIAKIR
jgi:predicted TPR repeat methyltransferase